MESLLLDVRHGIRSLERNRFCAPAVAFTLALAMTRFASSLLFGLESSDPLTMLAAICVLFAVAMLTGYIPARRASRLDPTNALRHE